MRLKDLVEIVIILFVILCMLGIIAFGVWYEFRKFWFFVSY